MFVEMHVSKSEKTKNWTTRKFFALYLGNMLFKPSGQVLVALLQRIVYVWNLTEWHTTSFSFFRVVSEAGFLNCAV